MPTSSSTRLPSFLAMALVTLVLFVAVQPKAHSNFPAANADEIRWQYGAMTIDASELQAKVLAIGNDGSEIVTIMRSDAYVEPGADGKTYLIPSKYEIITRKKIAQ